MTPEEANWRKASSAGERDDPTGENIDYGAILLTETSDHIQASGAMAPRSGDVLQEIVDGMVGQVAVVDADWTVVAANAAWIAEACQPHLRNRLGIGKNYKTFREWTLSVGFPEARRLLDGLNAMDEDRTRQVVHTYASTVLPGRYFHLSTNRFDVEGVRYATISRLDVTELFELRRQRLDLGARLLRAQEDERHRVARDFHDNAAQFLVAMGLGLMKLQHTTGDISSKAVASELSELLDHFHRDLRGLTYLLHPPELERGSLYAAIDTICQGMSRRSGLTIDLKVYGDTDERSPAVETTIYRVVQEALSNIHKHAKAKRVRIRLGLGAETGFQYALIEDDGQGLREPLREQRDLSTFGVGIHGMMARVEQLGGRLMVRNRRSGRGTMVVATLPNLASSSYSEAA